jgi:RHS repeat-associated protein
VGTETIACQSETDHLNRKVSDQAGSISRTFTYHAGVIPAEHQANGKTKGSATTQLVSQITLSDGRTLSYAYDEEERITKVTDSVDGVTEYTYDALGQLLTETVNGTVVNTMTYDNYGNIVSKNGVAYTYGDGVWKDLLTKVGEQTITYDAQGNPTSYLGHTLTWEKGRQLKSFDGNTYTYNANGIRTSKTVDGVRHDFVLDGTKILRETWGKNVLIPLYDNEDSVCGISFNGEYFYFQKNLQGDIISITDQDANEIAKYTYDAWGVCTIVSDTSACNIATINPFRYRGYYYDNETQLYYLQSRYYNPSIGRFVNADESDYFALTNNKTSNNLFWYCENEPITNADSSCCFVIRRWMVAAIIDFLLMLIPGIGAAFAPVKSIAKAFSKAALKANIKTPLVSFIKTIARLAKTIIGGMQKGLSKLWGVGRWLASKIPVSKLSTMLAGLATSVLFNKVLNTLIENVDIVLSVGGAISGILDVCFDKKLNNSIWSF